MRRALVVEHALLLLGRQAGEQRQDFHMRRMVLAQRFGGVADFALAGQEHQHVAGADAGQFVHAIDHGIHQVALFARGRRALRLAFGIGHGRIRHIASIGR
jgi:hypothetical protein